MGSSWLTLPISHEKSAVKRLKTSSRALTSSWSASTNSAIKSSSTISSVTFFSPSLIDNFSANESSEYSLPYPVGSTHTSTFFSGSFTSSCAAWTGGYYCGCSGSGWAACSYFTSSFGSVLLNFEAKERPASDEPVCFKYALPKAIAARGEWSRRPDATVVYLFLRLFGLSYCIFDHFFSLICCISQFLYSLFNDR